MRNQVSKKLRERERGKFKEVEKDTLKERRGAKIKNIGEGKVRAREGDRRDIKR
jgi:hypothetical protein